jgi:hypothetical protein
MWVVAISGFRGWWWPSHGFGAVNGGVGLLWLAWLRDRGCPKAQGEIYARLLLVSGSAAYGTRFLLGGTVVESS